jgi:hypothetical protein
MSEHDKQEWISSSFIGIGLAGMGFFGALAAASATLGPVAVPIWGIAIGIVAVTVRSPVAKAFAERLSGKPSSQQESIGTNEVFAELDELRARVLELEERQDFAERLLAKGDTQGDR